MEIKQHDVGLTDVQMGILCGPAWSGARQVKAAMLQGGWLEGEEVDLAKEKESATGSGGRGGLTLMKGSFWLASLEGVASCLTILPTWVLSPVRHTMASTSSSGSTAFHTCSACHAT